VGRRLVRRVDGVAVVVPADGAQARQAEAAPAVESTEIEGSAGDEDTSDEEEKAGVPAEEAALGESEPESEDALEQEGEPAATAVTSDADDQDEDPKKSDA
jgi:hypothetical protein